MKLAPKVLTTLCLALCLAAVAAAQTALWVGSRQASLKAERKAFSTTVVKLPSGTALTVLETAGKWYRVATPDGVQGWIYRGKVVSAPPTQEVQGGGGLFGSLTGSSIQAGASDTSRSIRGLSPETEQYANSAGSPQQNRDALDQLMALKITDAELEQFLQAGPVGEYAP